MKKRSLFLGLSALVLTAGIVIPCVSFGSSLDLKSEVSDEIKLVSDLFELNSVRAKVSSLAPTSSTYSSSETGLLLFSYDSGSVASYKQILNGTTTFRSIASTKDKPTPDLTHYSYKITDIKTNESFKIHVITGEKVTTYYVESDGKVAGESYFSSINGLVTHGYTKLYNNSGTFTQVTSTGLNIDSKITFNPTDMSVVVTGQTKNFEVWNFKNDFIDGKAQIKHLSGFENYKVDIVFEEVISGLKGELLLYEIGNKKFDSAILNNPLTLVADLSLKGVVGKPYYLPIPSGEDIKNISVWVYKEVNGEPVEIMNGKLTSSSSFIPDQAGDYYILYKGLEGELRDKITVISSETTDSNFTSNVLDNTGYGFNSVITVPDLIYSTNRSDKDLGSTVTIKCGSETIVSDRLPGFDFSFNHHDKSKIGNTEYTFIYKCINNNIGEEISKTVVVSSSNAVSYFKPYLSDYASGSEIEISKGVVYKDGVEYVCDADVVYPSESKVVTHKANEFTTNNPKLKLDANGTFTIRYHNEALGANFVGSFRAMPNVVSLFDSVDASASFGTSSSSDSNAGVVGTFKNDGTLTYNKLIDPSTLTKDKKLISLMAQPKVPGTPEINHIYVTVEDESNPDNAFEIRLSQGADNVIDKTFIRAQAPGQKYGSYYYNSWFDIDSYIAVERWFNDLSFGDEATKKFNSFECQSIFNGETMTLKIDHDPKNLHFIQTGITSSSFKEDLGAFIEEYNDEITRRLGDGRLKSSDVGQVHEPEITWQADSAHDQGGFLHEHSFNGQMDTYSFENWDYVDLYYDNEDKALYTNFLYHVAGYQPEERIVKFCDFDDPNTFGADVAWDGFTSDKVKISVRATGVSDETGQVFIREICGNKFNSELLGDDDNPLIKIDDSIIPNAKVGVPFKPLDAIYSDNTSAIETKSISVVGPNGAVALEDGKFTPTVEGDYEVTYSAVDSFGNETTSSIVITAKNSSYFNEFDAELNVVDGQDVQYGINYKIPDPIVSGGCGKYSIEKTVTVKTTGGEDLTLDVINGSVKVLYSGTYSVNIVATDYLGESETLNYTFTSNFTSDPIYEDELILPERLFKGVPYDLGQFRCKLFEKEGEEQKEIMLKARITDATGAPYVLDEDMIYTPNCTSGNNTALIELFVNVDGKDIVVDRATTEVFDLNDTTCIYDGYFINSDNVESIGYFGAYLLKNNGPKGTIESKFVSPLRDDFVSFEFSQYYQSGKNKVSKSNLSSLSFTLTDFENPDISFDIVYTQKTNGVYVTLPKNNSAGEFKVANSFTDVNLTGNMGFTFNNAANSILDISGSIIGRITKCNNGDQFTGFTSGKVLLSLKAEDVENDNGIYLKKLANISLDNATEDTIAPSLTVNGSYGGYVQENEVVTLPSASAYDVLSYCGVPTLSISSESTGEYVKDVNGLVMNDVPADKEYSVAFDKFGTYKVEYKSVDSAGNEVIAGSRPYYVTDTEPASVTFTNELKNDSCEVALFSKINVGDFTVVDNAGQEGCSVYIYAVLPTSEVITLRTYQEDKDTNEIKPVFTENCPDGYFEFTGLGMYQIIYLITDSNNNYSAVTKVVNVK